MTGFHIRPALGSDLGAQQHVIRAAWEEAYAHIYSPAELRALFAGELSERTTWTNGRTLHVGGYVAIADDMVVGTIGLALRGSAVGEVASLYVHPDHQGVGVGSALWGEGLATLRHYNCHTVVVYALDRTASLDFYRGRGLRHTADGTYFIGEHAERTLCFSGPLHRLPGEASA